VIVTEMTDNRGLMLPLMTVVLLGRASSALVSRTPLYRSLARRFLPAAKAPPAADAVARPGQGDAS
jgi:H+/Cl- antiporter ClcA